MRLTGLDTAFLCLDRQVSPMHLGALAIFRSAQLVDPQRVVVLLVERAQRLPQLRRRVQSCWFPLAAATWAEDPGFWVGDHIYLHHLEDGESLDGAAAMAADLMLRPLPRDRPLWEFHVIAGIGEDRFGVLFKMHHAFGDGVNASEVAARLLEGFPSPAADAAQIGNGEALTTEPSVLARLWQAPGELLDTVEDVLAQVSGAAGIAASMLRRIRLPAPGSPLLVSTSGRWALAVTALDLPQVCRVRAQYGGTVNDVLLAVVTGALRHWILARGGRVDGLTLRAFIPVSLHPRAGERIGGNRLSGYPCDLPVGEPDPSARLLMIRRTMEQNRAIGGGSGPGAIPLLAEWLPPVVLRVAAPVASQGAPLLFDLVITSIRVPGIRFTLDGAELDGVFPIAPLAAGHALVIGLARYKERIFIALNADREGLPDVQRLAEAMEPSVDALNSLIE